MARSFSNAFSRAIYRFLVGLHPPAFQARFGDEMLWIFDEVARSRGTLSLFGDVLLSLGRQWVVRSGLQQLWPRELASPWPNSSQELFAWERIGFPATHLPVPRMLQGGMLSFAFIGCLSLLALDVGKAATLRHGFVARTPANDVCRTKYPRTRTRGRSSDILLANQNSQAGSGSAQTEGFLSGLADDTASPLDPAGAGEAIPVIDLALSPPPASQESARILTAQYNNERTGANLNEKILAPANVNSNQFGKLFTLKVDGDVYAQPLYLSDVEIPGKGKHNVVFVATENDSVYAFDADGTSLDPLWHATLADSKSGAAPLSDRDTRCFFIVPQVGITSTPVIDLKTGTLYVLARTKEGKGFKQRLHALAVTTGAEKMGGPVEITASVQGTGRGRSGGRIAFDPLAENQRAALLLASDSVYIAWGSSCDIETYHGWLIAYDAHTLAQKAAFNTSPDAADSAIWQGDAGPAADKNGNIFVVTGNGEFDAATGGRDFGDFVLKLNLDGSSFSLRDYFTPSNQQQLNARDNDLGSSGTVLLPDQPGPHPHLLVTAGKEGKIYLIDRDNMGKFQPGDDPHAVQTISASRGAFGAMAYWNQNVYFIGSEAAVEDFSVSAGQLKLKAAGNAKFLDSGATPVVSSNGTQNGIVWAASSKNWNEPPGRPAVLYAFDSSDVTHELYSTEQNATRDHAGVALRFAMPSVVNGKVYLGTKGEVDVYGLLPRH
jgi:hypothetical protein